MFWREVSYKIHITETNAQMKNVKFKACGVKYMLKYKVQIKYKVLIKSVVLNLSE